MGAKSGKLTRNESYHPPYNIPITPKLTNYNPPPKQDTIKSILKPHIKDSESLSSTTSSRQSVTFYDEKDVRFTGSNCLLSTNSSELSPTIRKSANINQNSRHRRSHASVTNLNNIFSESTETLKAAPTVNDKSSYLNIRYNNNNINSGPFQSHPDTFPTNNETLKPTKSKFDRPGIQKPYSTVNERIIDANLNHKFSKSNLSHNNYNNLQTNSISTNSSISNIQFDTINSMRFNNVNQMKRAKPVLNGSMFNLSHNTDIYTVKSTNM